MRSGVVRPGRIALSRSTKPSGVLETNSRAVWVDTSVVDLSGSVNFTAIPRTPGESSGCVGFPDPLEKRISAGTVEPSRCFARESKAASGLAVKVPRYSVPFACNARQPAPGTSNRLNCVVDRDRSAHGRILEASMGKTEEFDHTVITTRGIAAIDGNSLAADEGGIGRQQEGRHGRDLLRLAKPLQ